MSQRQFAKNWNTVFSRRKVASSTERMADIQKARATCDHEWKAAEKTLYDYIEVVAECTKCGTHKGREI